MTPGGKKQRPSEPHPPQTQKRVCVYVSACVSVWVRVYSGRGQRPAWDVVPHLDFYRPASLVWGSARQLGWDSCPTRPWDLVYIPPQPPRRDYKCLRLCLAFSHGFCWGPLASTLVTEPAPRPREAGFIPSRLESFILKQIWLKPLVSWKKN